MMEIKKTLFSIETLFLGIISVSMFILMKINYLLFHSFIEIFAIVIFFTTFLITILSRKVVDNPLLIIIGFSSVSIALLDLFHMLSYKGMGVFNEITSNIPTQFWIAARYFQCLSFSIAIVLNRYHINSIIVLLIDLILVTFVLLSILVFPIFPDCYIEGR